MGSKPGNVSLKGLRIEKVLINHFITTEGIGKLICVNRYWPCNILPEVRIEWILYLPRAAFINDHMFLKQSAPGIKINICRWTCTPVQKSCFVFVQVASHCFDVFTDIFKKHPPCRGQRFSLSSRTGEIAFSKGFECVHCSKFSPTLCCISSAFKVFLKPVLLTQNWNGSLASTRSRPSQSFVLSKSYSTLCKAYITSLNTTSLSH